MSSRVRVLLADGSSSELERVRAVLNAADANFSVASACNLAELLQHLKSQLFDIVLCDAHLPGMEVDQLIDNARRFQMEVPLLLMADSPNIDEAIAAMKWGIADYLSKSAATLEQLPKLLCDVVARAELASPQPKTAPPGDQRFRALIAHSYDGVVLLDSDGHVHFASPSTSRILGYSIPEFEQLHFFLLLHPEDRSFVQEQVRRYLDKTGESTSLAFRLRHQEGAWIWVEGTFTNLLNEPAVRALALHFRDIGLKIRFTQVSVGSSPTFGTQAG